MRSFDNQLRITEIFHSLQGESVKVGLPTVFVRLTGCPLRCQYCDSAYAFSGGSLMDFDSIMRTVAQYRSRHVCVTGGEPLAQPACLSLLTRLCDEGYSVSLETSGARDISGVDERVMIVMDLKTPASNECEKNLMANLDYLKPNDQIKFVLCNRSDYEWASALIKEHRMEGRVDLLFSPSWNQLPPTDLANWIVQDALQVRFQLQLHKILWNDMPGK